MVTTRYSNQPKKRETYRRKDDVFGYELQFLESEGLPVFQKRSCNLRRKLSDVLHIQQSPHVTQNVLFAIGG